MKNGRGKLISFITVFVLGFSIFLFVIFRSYNYELEYNIDAYHIKEMYNKEGAVMK